MRGITWRRAAGSLWAVLAASAAISLSAFGMSGPGSGAPAPEPGKTEAMPEEESGYTAVDGNQISEERLQDGIVEYDELGSLVHYGNLSIQEMLASTESTRQDYQEIRDYLRTERASAGEEKKRAKEDDDMEGYMEYASLEEVYRSAAKSYNEQIKKLDRYSSNKTRLSLEKQLTNAAQSLMISWQSIQLQKEYLESMRGLYQEVYENTILQQSAGLATGVDAAEAYQNWNDVEISLSGMEDSEASICQSLYQILGIEDEASPKRIPPVNAEQLSGRNLEEDIQKAIGNHADVIAERDTKSAGTASGNKKQRTLEELGEKIKIELEQLYEEVNQKKQGYDAARAGLEGAKIQWKTAQDQYALGMLSIAEYLQKQMQYIQKKTAYESADLALFQALENYNWAVKGMITLD